MRDGAWWWQRTADLLAQRGVVSTAPALPGCGEADVPAGADGPGAGTFTVRPEMLAGTFSQDCDPPVRTGRCRPRAVATA